MSEELNIGFNTAEAVGGIKELASALKNLKAAVQELDNTPANRLKQEMGQIVGATNTLSKSMDSMATELGNKLDEAMKKIEAGAKKGARNAAKAAQEELDKNPVTVRTTVGSVVNAQGAKTTFSIKGADASAAQAAKDAALAGGGAYDPSAMAWRAKLMVGSLAIEMKQREAEERAAADALAAQQKQMLSVLKAQSRSMWSELGAVEKAEEERFMGTLRVLKEQNKAMWAEKGAEEAAAQQAYNAKLRSISTQTKAMWAEKAAEEKAAQEASANRLALIGRQARAMMNQEGAVGDYSVSEGARIGTLKTLAVAQAEVAKATDDGVSPTKRLTDAKARLNKEMQEMKFAVRGLSSGFGAMWLTWGSILPLMAGAGISSALVQTAKIGAEVEEAMTKIRVLTDESAQSVGVLKNQLLEIARSGPFGPLEVAEAMKTLALAGQNAAEVGTSIKDVLNFSVGGDVNIKTAADTLTSVATAFNVSATGYGYISDIISKAAATSKSSVEDFSGAMKTASVISKQYGVSLEDTAIGIALLANAGVRGTAAGTALRNMYADLGGKTKKVNDELKSLGVDTIDKLTGKMRNTRDIFVELMDAMEQKRDPKGAFKSIEIIFGERGGKEAIALFEALRTKADETGQTMATVFDQMYTDLYDSAGFAAIAAAEIAQTPLNQMKSVSATLQATLVESFDTMKPYLTEVALQLKDIFTSETFKAGLQDLIVMLGKATVWVLEHARAIASVLLAYAGLRSVISMVAAWGAATTALGAAASVAGVQVAQLGVIARMAAAANPLLLALSALATGAAAAWGLYAVNRRDADAANANATGQNKSTIEALESELDRLKLINEARRQKVSVAALEQSQKLQLLSTEAESESMAANRRLAKAQRDMATLEDPNSSLSFRKANRTRFTKELEDAKAEVARVEGDVNRVKKLKEDLSAEALKNANAERAEAEKRQKAAGALYKGNPIPDPIGGYASNLPKSNEMAEVVKRYNNEVSAIKKGEDSIRRTLQSEQSSRLVTEEQFSVAEAAVAQEGYRKRQAALEASQQAYIEAYNKTQATILANSALWRAKHPKATEQEKGQHQKAVDAAIQNAANEFETQKAKFEQDATTNRETELSRLAAQANKLEGALKSVGDSYAKFVRNLELADAQKARKRADDDLTRFASPDRKARLEAENAEREVLTQEMIRYDEEIRERNRLLEEGIALRYLDVGITEETIRQEGEARAATKRFNDELQRRLELLKAMMPGRVKKAGDVEDEETRKKKLADRDVWMGAQRASDAYFENLKDQGISAGNVVTKAFKGMEDALVNFVKNGKLDFSSLADSIISDLIRMQVQQSIMPAMKQGSADLIQWAATLFNANGNAFGSGGVHAFANGGAFTNGIYNRPTPFMFANGGGFSLGVMGEAGDEAVMPLTRSRNGKLGVQASGAGGGTSVVVNVIESPDRGGQQERRSEGGVDILDIYVEKVKSSIASDIKRGSGAVPAAMNSTYGLNRAVSSY